MYSITVVNRPRKGHNEAVYVGRGGKGVPASPLANPRRIGDREPGGGVWGRGETIELCERELRAALERSVPDASWNGERLTEARRPSIRDEMNRLFALVRREGRLELDCFYAPRACHGDVVRRLLEERLG